MSLGVKFAMAIGLCLALFGSGYAIYSRVYQSGFRDGEELANKKARAEIAKIEAKNKILAQQDSDAVVAKAEGTAKIVTVYKTIREKLHAEIVKVPVYRDCRISADSMRLIIAASIGGSVPANPEVPAHDPATGSTNAER